LLRLACCCRIYGGTDIAFESADIIILSDRVDALLAAREISRYSYGKILEPNAGVHVLRQAM
jgi:cation transport ATPase